MMPVKAALDWANGGWRQSPYAKSEPAGFGIDVDGNFGFQCADFVTAYSIFLGTPFNGGIVRNAITLWDAQPGWQKVSSPQPGDVFVREAVFSGVNYGDTGVVTSVTASGVKVVQQNLKADLYHGSPPDNFFWRFNQLIGFVRSNNIGEETPVEPADYKTNSGDVVNFYQNMLGRQPSQDEVNIYVNKPWKEVTEAFWVSGEFKNRVNQGFVPVSEQLFKKG